jgi:hypothetical protein
MGIDMIYESFIWKSVDKKSLFYNGFYYELVSPSPTLPHSPPYREMLVNDGWSSGLNLQGISREKK